VHGDDLEGLAPDIIEGKILAGLLTGDHDEVEIRIGIEVALDEMAEKILEARTY